MSLNPNHMHLQDRPYIYGGPYTKNEIDKFIKHAAKKGYKKVVDFSNGGKKYTVAKEMERITGKKFISKSNSKSNKSKKSEKKKPKKSEKKKPKKLLSLSARRSLKRKSVYLSN